MKIINLSNLILIFVIIFDNKILFRYAEYLFGFFLIRIVCEYYKKNLITFILILLLDYFFMKKTTIKNHIIIDISFYVFEIIFNYIDVSNFYKKYIFSYLESIKLQFSSKKSNKYIYIEDEFSNKKIADVRNSLSNRAVSIFDNSRNSFNNSNKNKTTAKEEYMCLSIIKSKEKKDY